MTIVMGDVAIRQVEPRDLDSCCTLEAACFPPAEAADPQSVQVRLQTYAEGFLVAETRGAKRAVVGMVNSGATHKADITDEAFKKLVGHDPDGSNLVVFSLAVLPQFQGRGIAGQLMRAYAERGAAMRKQRILLLCKDRLVPMYEHLGYRDAGLSASDHGGACWHEMVLDLAVHKGMA